MNHPTLILQYTKKAQQIHIMEIHPHKEPHKSQHQIVQLHIAAQQKVRTE